MGSAVMILWLRFWVEALIENELFVIKVLSTSRV
jgi:hypothetical protein